MRSANAVAKTRTGLLAATLAMAAALAALVPSGRVQAPSSSYIVQGTDLASTAAAVRRAGGRITHELGIINAVGAEMTAEAVERLRARPGLHVYGDRALRTSSVSPGSWTVRDDFSAASYANSNGTQAWAGSWVEAGDDGKANGGSVLISGGLLSLKSASRSLARPADLAGASAATLSFAYRREGFASSAEYVVAEMSMDGGVTWTEVWRSAGPGKDSALVNASVNVTAFASASARLRFRTSAGMLSKRLFLDNVQIAFTVPADPPAVQRPRRVPAGLLRGQQRDPPLVPGLVRVG